eukprot:9425784-Alexandrium_andersonii.AAC.1
MDKSRWTTALEAALSSFSRFPAEGLQPPHHTSMLGKAVQLGLRRCGRRNSWSMGTNSATDR